MEEKRSNEFIEALKQKVPNPCPMCGGRKFNVVEESHLSFHPPGSIIIGGPAVLVVIVGCENCGFVMQYALGPLGIKPKG